MSSSHEGEADQHSTATGGPHFGENVCPECSGTGTKDGTSCPTCDGTGTVLEPIYEE